MDLYLLIRYFACRTTPQEENLVRTWLLEDKDGSRANLFREAHLMFEGMVLYSEEAKLLSGRTQEPERLRHAWKRIGIAILRDKAVRLRIEGKIQQQTAKAIETEADVLSEEDASCLFGNEVADIFRKFMSTMPELTRDIFMDSRFEGLTYNEIAAKYNITPRKVKRDIQKVLEKMRISLKDYLPAILILFPGLLRI